MACHAACVVGGSDCERRQSARIDSVDHHRSTVGLVSDLFYVAIVLDHGQAFGDDQHDFPARQIAQAAEDGGDCLHGPDARSQATFGISRCVKSTQAAETFDPPTAEYEIVLQVVDSGQQFFGVGSELLKHSHSAACLEDRHQVVGLLIFRDEFPQGLLHRRKILPCHAQVIDHNREGPPHVGRLQIDGGRQRNVLGILSRGPWRSDPCRALAGVDVRKILDRLQLAILPDLKIGGGEVCNRPAFTVGDHGIHLNQVHLDVQHQVAGCLREQHAADQQDSDFA